MIGNELMLFLLDFCSIRTKIFVSYVAVVESICHVALHLIAFEIYWRDYFMYRL